MSGGAHQRTREHKVDQRWQVGSFAAVAKPMQQLGARQHQAIVLLEARGCGCGSGVQKPDQPGGRIKGAAAFTRNGAQPYIEAGQMGAGFGACA